MTLVVAASGGTDISVGAVSALSGAVCIAALGSRASISSSLYSQYFIGLIYRTNMWGV